MRDYNGYSIDPTSLIGYSRFMSEDKRFNCEPITRAAISTIAKNRHHRFTLDTLVEAMPQFPPDKAKAGIQHLLVPTDYDFGIFHIDGKNTISVIKIPPKEIRYRYSIMRQVCWV
jgi:hypothetical protein